ncbi:phosphate/phosphite/phosphonate ABC transporter substrate-binding protein [Sulfuriferula nivalis]|uniref:Phosphonate ABC transporter substrate-binding protein n=1 Tax=Sulfuriferula nivalis TaxID=2675298 RepID=A0A809REP1_9PROT|nr:phosphate/phosphite/phosphonate ABC transporter substrate-binding protein [Sulfuriferula nivalis]BBO99333.1 phosphonate ABC transporter substrate-binding protein [Sulfuriferula nivalis]
MRYWGLLILVLLLAGCGKTHKAVYEPSFSTKAPTNIKAYVVGIHPLHNPRRLMEMYGPILEYINATMPNVHFRIEASRNYEDFEKKLYSGHFDFAMPNPYQTVLSLKHGYHVFGKMGDDNNFRGVILVRKDSGIRTMNDLKGGKVAYPSPTALAGSMMPQYYLHTHGIDVNHDIENVYVGSQESAIMNVYRGHAAAGGTWMVPWLEYSAEHANQASQLEVKWQTGSLPNNAWVVRQDVPAALTSQFATALFGLNNSVQGRKMLARIPISNFEPATNATYAPVRNFLVVFSNSVRQVEQ